MDVLLNHTSTDSPWLLECPNACYNTDNTPGLRSAYVLDEALLNFSNQIAMRECPEFPEPFVRNDDDLDKIEELLRNKVVKPLKIEEYFLIDAKRESQAFTERLHQIEVGKNYSVHHQEDDDDMYNIFTDSKMKIVSTIITDNIKYLGVEPYGVSFDYDKLSELFINEPEKYSLGLVELAITKVNESNLRRVKGYLEEAIINIKSTIKDERLRANRTEIKLSDPLVTPYFSILEDGKTKAGHNGWIMDVDVLEDFADSSNFHFLRRTIHIWGDLVKLRYGKSKKDCPFLWKYMKQYVVETAKAFGGIRLDNAHSTPIHVAEYFLRKARKTNPSVYIFAELFTGNSNYDALFCKRIGFNCIVRGALDVILLFYTRLNFIILIKSGTPSDFAKAIFRNSEGSNISVGSLDPYLEIDDRSGISSFLSFDL